MSLRDFNSTSDERPIILNTDPVGNAGGLGGFHTTNPEDREPNNMPKILGGLVVALMLGGAGAYIYSVSGHAQPKQVVAANELPAPSAPAAQPAPQPAPMPASDSSTVNTPAPAPIPATNTMKTEPKSVPVHSSSITRSTRTADTGAAQARMQPDSTPAVQPQQQAVVAPEPVSPQAPASALANNGQPSNPEVAPQTDTAAPAQDQQTAATPAPAPAAQPAPAPQQ